MINKKACLPARQGFTLIETLVAVLLLTMAIAGPLTIASKGLSSALVAQDQVGAFYLAQDAIEYIRFKRDSNCLAAAAAPGACPAGVWLSGLVGSGKCTADGSVTCRVDSLQDSVAECTGTPTIVCPVINYDQQNFFYTYAATSSTVVESKQRYVRTVKITTPYGGNSEEARVEVKVSWIGISGIVRSVTTIENMLNWQ
jgi:prepilin-type N-terminal cleavage/methylation domain-containing protein